MSAAAPASAALVRGTGDEAPLSDAKKSAFCGHPGALLFLASPHLRYATALAACGQVSEAKAACDNGLRLAREVGKAESGRRAGSSDPVPLSLSPRDVNLGAMLEGEEVQSQSSDAARHWLRSDDSLVPEGQNRRILGNILKLRESLLVACLPTTIRDRHDTAGGSGSSSGVGGKGSRSDSYGMFERPEGIKRQLSDEGKKLLLRSMSDFSEDVEEFSEPTKVGRDAPGKSLSHERRAADVDDERYFRGPSPLLYFSSTTVGNGNDAKTDTDNAAGAPAMHSTSADPRARTRVYCDLDGVLCDFDKGVKQLTGRWPNEMAVAQMWRAVRSMHKSSNNNNPSDRGAGGGHNGFFASLDWAPGGRELWDTISPLNPTILTGIPMGGETWAAKQKRYVTLVGFSFLFCFFSSCISFSFMFCCTCRSVVPRSFVLLFWRNRFHFFLNN